MSLDSPQKATEVENDVAQQVAAEQPSSAPGTLVSSDLLGIWLNRPALPSEHVTEQAFQTLYRIFEAQCAVTRTFCDVAQRQQNFVLATTEATLSGLPAAIARQVDRTLTRVGDTCGQNLRMLGAWSNTMRALPHQALVAAQRPAAS